MLTIKRSCSYKIITRAVHLAGKPLVALLMPGADDCEPGLDQDQLQASLDAKPEAIIVYNQQADALALVENLKVPARQGPSDSPPALAHRPADCSAGGESEGPCQADFYRDTARYQGGTGLACNSQSSA